MKFYRWPNVPWAKYAVTAFLIVFTIGFVRDCQAADFEIGGGLTGGPALVAELSARTDNGKWDASVGYADTREERYGYESFAYASVQRIVRPIEGGPFVGLGIAAETEDGGERLPLPWAFALSLGADLGPHLRVEIKHFSNAGIKEPNRGHNQVTFGYRF